MKIRLTNVANRRRAYNGAVFEFKKANQPTWNEAPSGNAGALRCLSSWTTEKGRHKFQVQ